MQAKLGFESRDNRPFKEDVEESTRCQSRTNDSFACLCSVLPECRRALHETRATEDIGNEAKRRRRRGEKDFETAKVSGGERAAAARDRENDAIGKAAANATQRAVCSEQRS